MRMIHCADLHLDSSLTANLQEERRRKRQTEVLYSFRRMVRYAKEHQIEAILIAGDLFDSNVVSASAGNLVWQEILDHPEICFYYLKGNHDREGFFQKKGNIPDHLKLFSDTWTYYSHPCKKGQIVIAGAEQKEKGGFSLASSLFLHPDAFNIVMLHGQESEYGDGKEGISLRELRGKNIDYLALGHVHQFRQEPLDARGTWCYPGCLEGRGFDECGEHGFVVLEIEEETGIFQAEFVPFAERTLYTIEADVTGCLSTGELEKRVRDILLQIGCRGNSMLKILLLGQVPMDAEKNLGLLTKSLEEEYFFVKICDKTSYYVDAADYAMDPSFQGEFIRCVAGAKELSAEEKAVVIRYGIQALAGEEID